MFIWWRKSGIAARLLFALLAVWAAFNWGETMHRIAQYYVTIPVFDYWRVPQHVSEIRAWDFRYLWQQHNEHRIVFPDIGFALDVLLFRAQRVFPIVIGFACYFGSWVVIGRSVAVAHSLSGYVKASAITLAAAMIGWKGSALALGDPFLIQWTLMEFAFLLALLFLSRQCDRPIGGVQLAFVIACGAVATYCSGNGLLAWIVLLPAAYVCGCSKSQLTLLAAGGFLADGLYFVDYRFGGGLRLANLYLHPVYTAQFVASYLSMPFGGMKSPHFGVYVGSLNLAVMLLLFVAARRRKLTATRTGVVLFGFYLFVILTAVMTAAGRMEPGDTYFGNAKAARYLSLLLLNWGVVVAALVWILGRQGRRAAFALTIALALLMGIGFLKLRSWERGQMRVYVDAQVTQLSLENEVHDPRLLRNIFPSVAFVEDYLKVLRADQLSIYANKPQHAVGERMPARWRSNSGRAEGAVTRVFPVVSGVEIVGWSSVSSKRVIVVNEEQRIVGTGARLPLGLPSELLDPGMPAALAWIAFVPSSCAQGRFTVFTERDVQIGTTLEFPAIQSADISQVRTILPGVAWHADAAWTRDGVPPGDIAGAKPQGAVYSSWSGSDAHTGVIRSNSISVPENGCIVVPVLHGNAARRLAVKVIDAGGGTRIQAIPMQDEDMQWEFWRVPVASGRQVVIEGKDEGDGRGEWLALAPPARCR